MLAHLFERAFRPRADDSNLPHIAVPPADAKLHAVRPRHGEIVRANLATFDGTLDNGGATLHFRAGAHYIVEYGNGDEAPVECRIFERTYRRRWDGAYEKRPDLIVQYFTLPYAVIVKTLEGDKKAAAGDWIMRGVVGELYPVAPHVAERKYEHI
jgi:hypothetical protein